MQDLTTEEEKIKNKAPSHSLYCQLYKFMRSLTNIMFSNKSSKSMMFTSISSILFSKYLMDVYSALIQLAYGPLPIKQTVAIIPQSHDNNIQLASSIALEESTRDSGESEIERMRKDSIGMLRKVFER